MTSLRSGRQARQLPRSSLCFTLFVRCCRLYSEFLHVFSFDFSIRRSTRDVDDQDGDSRAVIKFKFLTKFVAFILQHFGGQGKVTVIRRQITVELATDTTDLSLESFGLVTDWSVGEVSGKFVKFGIDLYSASSRTRL